MAIQVERNIEKLLGEVAAVEGSLSPPEEPTGTEATRPGRLGRIYSRILEALLAMGRVGVFGIPAPGSGGAGQLTEQEREWLALYLRYDLHM